MEVNTDDYGDNEQGNAHVNKENGDYNSDCKTVMDAGGKNSNSNNSKDDNCDDCQ